MVANGLHLTTVWTIWFLQNLSLHTQLKASTKLSLLILCISVSIAMNVPVRPTPALHVHQQQTN